MNLEREQAWHPRSAAFECSRCPAAYPSPVHGPSLMGGSLICDSDCPAIAHLRATYSQPPAEVTP